MRESTHSDVSAVRVPVLEIGGSHVTAAAIGPGLATVLSRYDVPLHPYGSREELFDAFATAGGQLDAPAKATWGVAIPGPFDYAAGVGRFTGVGKFESLNGVDVGAALRDRLDARDVRFVNDADAFGMGEAVAGAARGYERVVCLTLGSGIGSAFLADGRLVKSGDEVPPSGYVYTVSYEQRGIEDWFSRRALRAAFRQASGRDAEVIQIADLVRHGDPVATQVWRTGFLAMTKALAPWFHRFGAQAVVIGGAIAKSWDVVEPAVVAGFEAAGSAVLVLPAARPDDAALLGAAQWACAG